MDRIGASDYMVPMTMASKDAAGTFNSGIRLIFIDGAHDYESVKSDILCWKDKLIDGGIIAFHDYYFPSVSRAIDELIRSPGKFTIEGTVGCTLFASKGTRKNAELFEKIIIFNSIKNAIRRIFKEKEMDGSPMLINEYRGIAPRIKLLIKKRLPGVYERHIKRISVAIIDRRRAGAIMASIKKIISVDPFPIFKLVEIETINRCNNTCQFCPVNRNDDPRPFRLMDESLFRSIIGQLRELNYSGCINLSANNEPLMDGRICELAGIARQALPSAYIHMVTNGMALTIDKLKNLMKHMDMLTIDNYDDDLKLIKPIRDVYDYCRFNNVYQDKIKIYLRLKTDILSNRAGQAKNRSKVKPLQSSCGYPFLQFVIRPDGKVSLCCNDALGQMTMGDLTKESISSVWNGAIFRETRERLLEGRKSVKLCSGCDGNI
jgi:MoaA/NifB/PqqE/SkfB family radical SAM enzyme